MPKLTAVLLLILCGITATPAAQAGEELTERVFPLPGHGTFSMWVPESWRQEIAQPNGEFPPTIAFLPAEGEAFVIWIMPIWQGDNPPAGYNSSGTIRAMVAETASRIRLSAADKRVEVMPIEGATGYYFSVITSDLDTRTVSDSHRYFVQGTVAVDDLLCLFTVVSNDPDSPSVMALSALGTAAHRTGN